MNHKTTTKSELSIDQQETLVEIISDQFGPRLSFDEFADQMLLLIEDVAGFEMVSDSDITPPHQPTMEYLSWSRQMKTPPLPRRNPT